MKLIYNIIIGIVLSFIIFVHPSFAIIKLTGAGATFPAPIYFKWADMYQKETGIEVNYQTIGSYGGMKQIISNTVDFGASDLPINDEILKNNNLFQFPTVIGGIVIAINVPGIKSNELILDGKTLNDIYLGKIKKWNDIAIINLNPNLELPDQTIIVIHRADGSGTSFVFTNYLAKVSLEWKEKIGVGSIVNWPVGLGGKGNDGVAAFIQRLSGTIGYIEYSYAKQNHLIYTKLVTADGNIISPTEQNFIESVNNLNLTKSDFQSCFQDLTNQPGNNSWPITSTTFIILNKQKSSFDNMKEVINFFNWAYKYGAQQAIELNYAALPEIITNNIRSLWKTELKIKTNKLFENRI